MIIKVFVPGALISPMNSDLRGRWYKHARWARTWRDKTCLYLLEACGKRGEVYAAHPKLITFIAHVGREFDDDNLRSALKPARDALKDMRLIDDDKPSAGHAFAYAQVIERDKTKRGVAITVEPMTARPA